MLGFDKTTFVETHLRPFIQDIGLRRRLVFTKNTRSVDTVGVLSDTTAVSETTGLVESNPKLDQSILRQVFPDGNISTEVVKVFVIMSDLSFTLKNGQMLDIYEDTVLLGNYRIKYITRNMIIPDFGTLYCVSSK
jgi:hypothetical protein